MKDGFDADERTEVGGGLRRVESIKAILPAVCLLDGLSVRED
jgi:hypothetical protein